MRCRALVPFVSMAILLASVESCSKGGGGGRGSHRGDDDDDDGDLPTSGALAISDNALAAAYPEGLAVSAFPQAVNGADVTQTAGSLILPADSRDSYLTTSTSRGETPADVLQDIRDRLDAKEGVSCFSPTIIQAMTYSDTFIDACYQFDIGMMDGEVMGAIEQGQFNNTVGNVSAPRTDAAVKAALSALILGGGGSVTANTSGEACMVASGRRLIGNAAGKVNAMLGLMQGILCEAKKAGIEELPSEEGDELDLTTQLQNAPSGQAEAYSWTGAKITRLADFGERPVYLTEIDFQATGGITRTTSLKIYHSPGVDGNFEHNGVIDLKVTESTSPNQPNYTSFLYSKSGSTVDTANIKFEVRAMGHSSSDPFDSEGRLNFNTDSASNGSYNGGVTTTGVDYVAFDVHPLTFAGKISYWANPGSNYNESARGFVYSTTQGSDGKIQGCAVAGAIREGSIRKSILAQTALSPTGCFTPQITNGACATGDNAGPRVYKQCFTQDSEGKYVVDTALTTDEAGFDVYQTAAEASPPDVNLLNMTTIGDIK
jgi:hypothetical protein